jgi:hypothetical protein
MASTILEPRALIIGQDDTGPAFKSVERRIAAISKSAAMAERVSRAYSQSMVAGMSKLGRFNFDQIAATERMVAGLSKAGAEAAAVAAKINMIGDAALSTERKISLLSRSMSGMKGAVGSAWKNIGPFVEGAAGGAVLHGVKSAVEAGADLEAERTLMRSAGIPQSEIAASQKQAYDLAAKYPNMSPAEIMKSYKETRSVVLNPSETPGLMETVIAAKSTMKELGMGGESADALQYAIKSAEVLGRAQDPKRFHDYIDSFVRALEVSGQTLTPEDMFRFAQQMKAAGATLSDRFINTVGMSMVQDMGSRAATGLAQFSKMMVGGYSQGQKRSLTEMYHLGMVDRDDLEWGKEGIKGVKAGHHLKHWREAITDPDKYVNDYLIPTLEKHGMESLQDQIAEVYKLYPNSQASNIIAKLIQQRLSFEQHARNYERAAGIDAASTLLRENAIASLDALTTSLKTFGAAVTDPLMEPIAGSLFNMATGIASFGRVVDDFDQRHPTLGKVLGGTAIFGGSALGLWGIYKMFSGFAGGFGLKSSAIALDASAAALDKAAVSLGATPGATPAKAASGAGAGAGAGGAVVAILSSVATAALAGGLVGLVSDLPSESGRGLVKIR